MMGSMYANKLKMSIKVLSILLLLVMCFEQICASDKKSPILIVPGLIASQVEAKASGHGLLCDTFSRFSHYWLDLLRLPTCVSSVLSLQYDEESGRYSNADGADVRIPHFGETEGVEFLDDSGQLFAMFHGFVEYFVNLGYVRGKTIRAAPYDWRLAADEHERAGYFRKMKNLIKDMYEEGGNEKVTLVGHSMGGPMTLYFLNNIVSQRWKNTYINAFIPLSGAWSGGNMAIPILISGIHSLLPEIPILSEYLENLSPAFQSSQSLIWLLPNPSVAQDNVLVKTSSSEYTANDYEQLFTDAGVPEYHAKHELVREINGDFSPPEVPTYCFYGVNVSTPEHFDYDAGFQHLIGIHMGDGDGQVNRISSEVCLRWSSQKAFFTSKEYSGLSHIPMLSNEELLADIAEAIANTQHGN